MNSAPDPVRSLRNSERLHYATGELLGADDFRAEQTYHRRQLARALSALHGAGVACGLRVVTTHRPGGASGQDEVELEVEPGIAIDRAGRPIEVPRKTCLWLRRWYEYGAGREPQNASESPHDIDRDDLRGAWRARSGGVGGAVVADVYLAFHSCDRGYTPAFASGPFDALDASQPSRIRDAFQLLLVPRPEADVDLPRAFDPWSAVTGNTEQERREAAQELSMAGWPYLNAWSEESLPPEVRDRIDNPDGVDPTAVLLARVVIPASESAPGIAPAADWSVAQWPARANVDNLVRTFLFPTSAVQRIAND